MVILEVLSGQVPFAQDTDFIVIRKVGEGECPERPEGAWFTDDLWRTLEQCWSFQPKDRPSVEVVLECLGRASVATATNSALQRLISRSFSEAELPSLLEIGRLDPCSDYFGACLAGACSACFGACSECSGIFLDCYAECCSDCCGDFIGGCECIGGQPLDSTTSPTNHHPPDYCVFC
jgi:hypothetical protein